MPNYEVNDAGNWALKERDVSSKAKEDRSQNLSWDSDWPETWSLTTELHTNQEKETQTPYEDGAPATTTVLTDVDTGQSQLDAHYSDGGGGKYDHNDCQQTDENNWTSNASGGYDACAQPSYQTQTVCEDGVVSTTGYGAGGGYICPMDRMKLIGPYPTSDSSTSSDSSSSTNGPTACATTAPSNVTPLSTTTSPALTTPQLTTLTPFSPLPAIAPPGQTTSDATGNCTSITDAPTTALASTSVIVVDQATQTAASASTTASNTTAAVDAVFADANAVQAVTDTSGAAADALTGAQSGGRMATQSPEIEAAPLAAQAAQVGSISIIKHGPRPGDGSCRPTSPSNRCWYGYEFTNWDTSARLSLVQRVTLTGTLTVNTDHGQVAVTIDESFIEAWVRGKAAGISYHIMDNHRLSPKPFADALEEATGRQFVGGAGTLFLNAGPSKWKVTSWELDVAMQYDMRDSYNSNWDFEPKDYATQSPGGGDHKYHRVASGSGVIANLAVDDSGKVIYPGGRTVPTTGWNDGQYHVVNNEKWVWKWQQGHQKPTTEYSGNYQ